MGSTSELASLSDKTHFDFLPNHGWSTVASLLVKKHPQEARNLYEYKLKQASSLEDKAGIYRHVLTVSRSAIGNEYRASSLAKYLAIVNEKQYTEFAYDQNRLYRSWAVEDLEMIEKAFKQEAQRDHSAPNRGRMLGVYYRIAQKFNTNPYVYDIARKWGLTKEEVGRSYPWTGCIDFWTVSGPYISEQGDKETLASPSDELIKWLSGDLDLVPTGRYVDPAKPHSHSKSLRGYIKPFNALNWMSSNHQGMTYAACAIINSPDDREAVFKFSTNAQHMLWLGNNVLIDKTEPNHIDEFPISLNKGDNRILIMINSTKDYPPSFKIHSEKNCDGLRFSAPEMVPK